MVKKSDGEITSKFTQIKQEFDNKKFNQNITNFHLDHILIRGLKELGAKIEKLAEQYFNT